MANELSLLIFIPLVGSVVVFGVSKANVKAGKAAAIVIAALTLAMSILTFLQYRASAPGFQMKENFPWAESFGLSYVVGVDGISLPLLIISTLLTTLVAVGSLNQITFKTGEYYALLLIFEGSIIGVFTSLNLILFYVFWELVLIPMFFFIGIWGGPRKKYAAMKFLIMTHVGSIFMLLGFIAFYVLSIPHTFDFETLLATRLPLTIQIFISVAFFLGFGIKLPVVPFHTWLPDAHVEAPAPISVLLAGLLLKMGGYGFIRLNLFLVPEASKVLAPVFVGFALLTMFYGAIVAMIQQDLKRMIALTSINHMGYVLLGTFSFTALGISGAVFQMFNHATAIGILFLMSGVIHEGMGTRSIRELAGLNRVMPKTGVLLILGSLAAMGFPGFGSFISEYMVILSAIAVNPAYAIAVLVPAITAGYFVWTIRRVVMAESSPGLKRHEAPWYILGTLAAFLVPLIVFGLYPAPILGVIDAMVPRVPAYRLI